MCSWYCCSRMASSQPISRNPLSDRTALVIPALSASLHTAPAEAGSSPSRGCAPGIAAREWPRPNPSHGTRSPIGPRWSFLHFQRACIPHQPRQEVVPAVDVLLVLLLENGLVPTHLTEPALRSDRAGHSCTFSELAYRTSRGRK